MKNLDNLNPELRSKIHAAMTSGDEKGVEDAMVALAIDIQENIVKEARSMMQNSVENHNIMMQRGQAQLTVEERAYYAEVKEKRGFTDLEITMPTTIFDRVFEDLEKQHPLLSAIDFQNTTGTTKWIVRKSGKQIATWGKLTSEITKELEGAFAEVDATLCKLTAFIPVSKDMLDLGAVWIDKYVRAILSEAISIGLEEAIISGDGKDKPIGMLMNLEGPVTLGVHTAKEAKPLADLSPNTLGNEIMSPLTLDGERQVPEVLIIVNPVDYWKKIFGLMTKLTDDGRYVTTPLPIPHNLIQSIACPKGKMIAGLAKDYFMGISGSSKIEHSDEAKFLEDQRIYLTKQYANGKPKDNNSFLVFDISNLGVAAAAKASTTGRKSNTPKEEKEDAK